MSTDSSAFWDGVAQRYAQMAMRNPQDYTRTLERVRAHLRAADSVLEIGCGTGTTAQNLAASVRRYTASDYSAVMIALAGEKRAAAGLENLDLCVGQLCDGSLPEGPFDALLAFNLLHLLPDRSSAFDDIAGHLRPGGLFISKTPCLGGVFRVFQPMLALLKRLGKAPDFSFVNPSALEAEIIQAGFEIVESADYSERPPRRFIVARKL